MADLLTGIGILATLAGVLVLTYYAPRWYARRMSGGALSGRHIIVHERVPMGNHASLAIVEVDGRFYLIGVSERGVQLVSVLEDFAPLPDARADSKVPFGKLFAELLAKTGKGSAKGDNGGDT